MGSWGPISWGPSETLCPVCLRLVSWNREEGRDFSLSVVSCLWSVNSLTLWPPLPMGWYPPGLEKACRLRLRKPLAHWSADNLGAWPRIWAGCPHKYFSNQHLLSTGHGPAPSRFWVHITDRKVHQLSGGSWSGEKDKQTSKEILSPWGQFYPLGRVLGKSISDDSEWAGPGVPKGL